MLSAKARAFSVDHLLGKCEQQPETGKEGKPVPDVNEELCPLMGDEPTCNHRNTIDVADCDGDKVTVELCQGDLWQAFHNLGTEMIITKTGRRMFPAIRVRISGLKKNSRYKLSMDFVPVDKNKYRYVYHSSKWMVSGIGDGLKHERKYSHPESPFSGEYISSQVISFEKIKLTNNDKPPEGQVSLLSMQKFQPRITIEEQLDTSKQKSCDRFSVSFPQTSFIAVTAYQNQEITRLKIARNPFAKGFREAGKCRSSLEAMMASLGAYMEPKHDSFHRKRPLEHDDDRLGDITISSTKRRMGVWPHLSNTPTMIPDSRYLPSYFQIPAASMSLWTNPYIYSDLLNRKTSPNIEDNSPEKYSSATDHKQANDHTVSQVHVANSRDSPERDSIIHPAFRWNTDTANSKYTDTKSLVSLSNGHLYNPLASIMYFPSPRPWTISASQTSETSKADIDSSVDASRQSQNA